MIASSSLGPFIGRFDKVLVASATGVETVPCSSVGLERRWSQHLDGVARLGLFPTLPTERCLFGVVDLDCHDRYTPDRHEEATRLVAFLARIGIAGYRVPSRGVRGAHVWLFFRRVPLVAVLSAAMVSGSLLGGVLIEIGSHLPFVVGVASSSVGTLCIWRLCTRLDAGRAAVGGIAPTPGDSADARG